MHNTNPINKIRYNPQKPVFMMKASSLALNLASDLAFPLMTPVIHILPIQLNQDNRRTKDELVSKIKEEIDFFFKIPELKIFQLIKQIYLPYLFKFWMSSLFNFLKQEFYVCLCTLMSQ